MAPGVSEDAGIDTEDCEPFLALAISLFAFGAPRPNSVPLEAPNVTVNHDSSGPFSCHCSDVSTPGMSKKKRKKSMIHWVYHWLKFDFSS